MISLILIFPLLGSFFSGSWGNYVGRVGSVHITIFCMILTCLCSIFFLIFTTLRNEIFFLDLGLWIAIDIFIVNWGFLFDSVALSMLCMISVVSTCVHIYSSGYMSEDPHLSRFMSYLSLFTFFMFILITADNFIQLFLGWEGVGVCSYLLINFWFTRVQANKSALKALIMNRIGDFGLLIGILLIFFYFRSVDFAVVFVLAPYFNLIECCFLGHPLKILSVISFFLFVGSVGKSAQIGLHTWLPDAMEGPTPVSALIHAATMVTAGVFLIIRCSPIFEYSSDILLLIALIGSLTAFFASVIGLFQHDLKKVIAYSTCSQLGYMIFACGASSYSLSLFHLINHAFFKALLFLGSGIIIHGLNNEQDMRRMGGLIKLFPFTYISMLIGSLALGGFPFLSAFYSKDLILELILFKHHSIFVNDFESYIWKFISIFGLLATPLTSFYSVRLLYLTFGNKPKFFYYNVTKIHEGNNYLIFPLLILIIGSLFSGFILKDIFVGIGTDYFGSSILNLKSHSDYFIDLEFCGNLNNNYLIYSQYTNYFLSNFSFWVKIIPTFLSLLGGFFALIFYVGFNHIFKNKIKFDSFIDLNVKNTLIYNFFNQKWFFDFTYNKYIGFSIFSFAYWVTYKVLDKGFLELIGPFGFSRFIYKISNSTSYFQNGLMYSYLNILLITFLFILFFVIHLII